MISAQDSQHVTKPTKEATKSGPPARASARGIPTLSARLADAGLVALFLALTFLLGVFPLKDVDFYWHLRTGDLIRQTGDIPHVDIYTFTREGTPWIDLHWVYQVGISWLHERGGVPALNLVKCAITAVAVLLLVTARKRDWPLWVMILAWLPALLLLGGRMYVRPETLTLLYLAIFLAVATRWDRMPVLALVLPLVQVAWVNSQGLFVLGPIVLVFGLIDAVLTRVAFGPERKPWWRTVGIASALTFAACLVNPYGVTGALYPAQLAATMSNPVFSKNIAELKPIPDFIEESGLRNLPLQIHLVTLALGGLSFVVPLCWVIGTVYSGVRSAAGPAQRGESKPAPAAATQGKGDAQRARARNKKKPPKRAAGGRNGLAAPWRLSPFRLLLYASFSLLSLQATRNSHQFAAVVGSITAWNFGEWAAATRRRRAVLAGSAAAPAAAPFVPQAIAAVATLSVLVWVGSGSFYDMAGEKRTIGLGEEPLWFPHEAAKFAGRPELPERFLSFHNAHASLFEYYHGPKRKVYTDPRLEVAGVELFERYQKLQKQIASDQSGWEAELNNMGRPVVLVDHEFNAHLGAVLLRSARWRCVWFDAIAAVFVPDSATAAVQKHAVDFAARHFRPDPSMEPRDIPGLTALAKAMRNYVSAMAPYRSDLARPLVWLGLDGGRRILQNAPDSLDAWKVIGEIELAREPSATPSPRFRLAYDPVFDLSMVRATYALHRALELSPDDFRTLLRLSEAYAARLMYEAELPLLERIALIRPLNPYQRDLQSKVEPKREECARKLGSPPSLSWRNLSELDRVVLALLAGGRAETAARLLETAYTADRAPWEVVDRVATLRLHLGEPARARELWQKAASVPDPAIAQSRVATTYFVEGNWESARAGFEKALELRPKLFEACYSLAVLEQDAGNAVRAHDLAFKAMEAAPSDVARTAARMIAETVAAYRRE
jgi:tetratricopeptide (TPR) repeat protein